MTTALAIGEGIETALSLMVIDDWCGPVWSCLFAANLAEFPVLGGIGSLVVVVDADEADAERRLTRWRAGMRPAAKRWCSNRSAWAAISTISFARAEVMGAYTNTAEELLKQTGPQFLLRTMPSPDVLPAPGLPMEVAEQFFKGRCREGQAAILVHWRGAFYRWQRTCWIETPDRVVRNWLYRFCQKAKYTNNKGDAVPWGPSKRKIGDVLEALQAICPLDDENDQPCWIDERETGVIVSCLNGLLDVEKRVLTLHTSLFFNGTYVPFAYQPSAPKPERWLQFLDALFAKEPAGIDALGEWFGYVISGRTNLHKIMLMVEPSRAGKGVISRILRALIGAVNVAGPTLNSLGTDFGLAPLLGKSLAIISDARFTGKSAAVITERLLSISGEDALTVDRKYRDATTGRLPCRFHIISNELPASATHRRRS